MKGYTSITVVKLLKYFSSVSKNSLFTLSFRISSSDSGFVSCFSSVFTLFNSAIRVASILSRVLLIISEVHTKTIRDFFCFLFKECLHAKCVSFGLPGRAMRYTRFCFTKIVIYSIVFYSPWGGGAYRELSLQRMISCEGCCCQPLVYRRWGWASVLQLGSQKRALTASGPCVAPMVASRLSPSSAGWIGVWGGGEWINDVIKK